MSANQSGASSTIRLQPRASAVTNHRAPSIPTLGSTYESTQQPPTLLNPRPRSRQRRSPPTTTQDLPQLQGVVETTAGQSAIVSILSEVKSDGYENSLVYGKRGQWFIDKNDGFFNIGGILASFRKCSPLNVQRKFKLAEDDAKLLYNNSAHQPDTTGIRTEADRPLYTESFFDYFDFEGTRDTTLTAARRARERNTRVNRSLIGQQPAFDSDTSSTRLLSTVAPSDAERGTGQVASQVTTNIIQVQNSTTTNASSNQRRQQRQMAPTDGRNQNNSTTYNMGLNNNAFLPPSQRNNGSINIDRMENGFNNIASSLHNLAMQNRIRRVGDINNELIATIREKVELEHANADNAIIDAYNTKIDDLKAERTQAQQFDSSLLSSSSLFASSGVATASHSNNN